MDSTSRWLPACLATTLLLGACTSLQPVSSPTTGSDRLQPGEDVEVETLDGTHYKFKVVAVDAEAIAGEDVRVPLSDIASVYRREISVARTAGVAGGLCVVYFGILMFGSGGAGTL